MRVLILYAKAGNGHYKAAEAIKEKLEETTDDTVFFEDGLEYSSKIINKLMVSGYANLTKYMPNAWGAIYSNSDTQERSTINEIAKLAHKALTIRLKRMLRQINPDIIISTHMSVSKICAYLKKKGKTEAKIITVMTDYAIHNMWVEDYKYYDKILMATDEMYEDCITYGIEQSKLRVTGIPTSSAFLQKYDRTETLKKHGLEDKLTCLFFAGGGQGIGKSKEYFKEILEMKGDFQLMVVAGKNEKLKEKYEKLAKASNKKVVVLGYTNEVPELMNMCDFVVSKPGGLTSTECLVMNKPLLIINPIPGQEEKNAIYLTNNGVALRTYEDEPISHQINILINNKFRVNQIIEMCKHIAKPNSSQEILDIIKETSGL